MINGKPMVNIYEGESMIANAIDKMFLPDLMFSTDTVSRLDNKYLTRFHETERVACLIELMGYKTPDTDEYKAFRRRSTSVIIIPEWRISVIAPSELYNNLLGTKLVDVISVLSGRLDNQCNASFEMANDVRAGHTPLIDSSLTLLYTTMKYHSIIHGAKDNV